MRAIAGVKMLSQCFIEIEANFTVTVTVNNTDNA